MSSHLCLQLQIILVLSFVPLLWQWGIWSSQHQYKRNGSLSPICIQSPIVTTNPCTSTSMPLSLLLASDSPHWPISCYLSLQNPNCKLLPLPRLPCGTWTPYSSLSGSRNPYQASTVTSLCGCLPHATWALTSGSRPPWANALLNLLGLIHFAGSPPLPYPVQIPILHGPPHGS